jgi:secondary thiamine-phosphate synthase enzyme
MSRSSTATVRERPVATTTTVSGTIQIHAETLTIPTDERVQLIDLTDRVMALVARLGVREGVLNLCSLHTTSTLFVNEYQPALQSDMKAFLEHIVDADAGWMHNDPAHSDCDRANADSHLRAMLMGHSLSLQISGGEIVLGQWQRILMAELDGPRPRQLRAQVMGV